MTLNNYSLLCEVVRRDGGLTFYDDIAPAVIPLLMAVDFGAGCLGGAAGVIVGQPFDTVKVRLQVAQSGSTLYKGVFDCASKMVKQESFFSLYKGMTPPLIGLAFQNAIIFGLQAQFRPFCGLGTRGEVLAGAFTGALQAGITAPIELAKIRLQVQGKGCKVVFFNKRKYKGAIHTINTIYKEEGLRACFRGLSGVLMRDIPATGVYFGSFHYFNTLLIPDGETMDALCFYHLLLTGGFAGIMSWASLYPIDVVKTRIQAEGLLPTGKYKSYLQCFTVSLKEEGHSFLTRGFGATMLRAFPVNSAILATVTLVLRFVNKDNDPAG